MQLQIIHGEKPERNWRGLAKLIGSLAVLGVASVGSYYLGKQNERAAQKAHIENVAQSPASQETATSKPVPRYDEINGWFFAPPVGYNPEIPIKSGGFEPYEKFPFPTEFVKQPIETETLRRAVFSLEELLATNIPALQKFVSVYPPDWNGASDFVYIYGTATDWFCPGCESLKKQGLEAKLKAEIDKDYRGKFALIKILCPDKKPLPALFDKGREFYSAGVPVLLVGENKGRQVKILAEVPSEDFSVAFGDSRSLMERVAAGKPVSTVVLTRDDFRDYKVAFSAEREGQKPFYDQFAILYGHALFPEHFSFDAQKKQFVFRGNLAEPDVFDFVRAYNDRYGKASLGRNVFRKIKQETADFYLKIVENSPVFQQIAEWTYNERDTLWDEEPNSENYWQKYRAAQKRLFNLTNGCVPYVEDFYRNSLEQKIRIFEGLPGVSVSFIPELNSPRVHGIVRELAKKNHWQLDERHLPTEEDIGNWQTRYALPAETVQSLQETRRDLDRALQTMQALGVDYLQPTLPYQTVDVMLNSSERTFVLSAPPEYSDFIPETNEFADEHATSDSDRALENYQTLRALLCLAEKPEYNCIRKIFVPYHETTLGKELHPESDLQGYVAPVMGGIRNGLVLLKGEKLEILFPAGSKEPSARKMIKVSGLNKLLQGN